MAQSSKILVIVGSIRARRICPQVAAWIAEVGRETNPAHAFEVVDLKDWPLPMDDEPGIPAAGGYVCAHTLAWSQKVAEGDGFVFVSPQYNWGYPAPLKNALDHLYHEWSGKPAMIATYGGHGGGKCAEQLRQVLDGFKMKAVPTMPGFTLPRDVVEANAGHIDPASQFGAHLESLRQAFVELSALLAP